MLELLLTTAVIAAAAVSFRAARAHTEPVSLGDTLESDLPCPWCRAATDETDTSCPSCDRVFGAD